MNFYFTDLFIPLLSKWVLGNTMKVLRTVLWIILGAIFIVVFVSKYSQLYIDFDGNYVSVLLLQAFLRTLVSVEIVLGVLLVIKLLLIASDAVFNIVFADPTPSDTIADSSTRLDLEGKMDDTVKQIIQQYLSSAHSGADYAALFIAISESKKFVKMDWKRLYSVLSERFPEEMKVTYQHVVREIREYEETITSSEGKAFYSYPKKVEKLHDDKNAIIAQLNKRITN